MSFGELLFLKRLSVGILSLTAMLVVLFGGGVLFAAFSSPPDMRLTPPAGESLLASTQARAPSSVAGLVVAPASVLKAEPLVETFALGCLENGKRLELTSHANQVRLKATLCGGKSVALAESSIVNRANGFEATLFRLANGDFTSDYIDLAEGANSLFVEMQDEAGTRSKVEVVISRR